MVIQSFADLLKLWPSAGELASDLDVKEVTARAWRRRGVPSEYWLALVEAAQARSIEGVTLDLLAKLAALQAGRPLPEGMAA